MPAATETFSFTGRDLSAEIERTSQEGIVLAPAFLTQEELKLFDRVYKTMEAQDPEYMRLSRSRTFGLTDWQGYPELVEPLSKLQDALGSAIKLYADTYPVLSGWKPNVLTPMYLPWKMGKTGRAFYAYQSFLTL